MSVGGVSGQTVLVYHSKINMVLCGLYMAGAFSD